MQRLYVVGFTTDHEGLVLSARRGTKSGGWTVNVDADLEEAVAAVLKERGEAAESRIPRAESQLSVREMQQRLRSGQSIQQVARAAGVSDEWVARFAIPIQAEQTQVVRQAFDLTFSKQRLGISAQPLGVAVWWNLQDRSVILDEEQWESGWSAFQVREQQWVVRFEYEARKRRQVAEWEVDLRGGTLNSRNRLATDLGFVEAGRRRRAGPPAPMAGGLVTRPQPIVNDPPPPSTAMPPSLSAASPRRRPAKRARRAAAKKVAAKKSVAKKAPAKKATAKKASPRARATKKKAAPRKAAGRKAAPRPVVVTPAPRPVVATPTPRVSSPRTAPVMSAGASARPATPSVSRPVLTPPPAPSTRKRPVDNNGRPVRRDEPLRAR